jgi:hypothetical protein
MAEKKLSKKEQKAVAFRKKGKKNAEAEEPQAIPDSDLIDENATTHAASTGKRSRSDEESAKPDEEPQEKRIKKNRRPKKKNASHTGYILFVGKCWCISRIVSIPWPFYC